MELQQAKQLVSNNLEKGTICPCCDQFVKRYKRPLNISMILDLKAMCKKEGAENFFHVEDYLFSIGRKSSRDFHKLRFWGLIEAKEAKRNDGSNRVGLYRITQKGKDFISGLIKIPKYALIFNNKLLGYSGEGVFFNQVTEGFNYSELINS